MDFFILKALIGRVFSVWGITWVLLAVSFLSCVAKPSGKIGNVLLLSACCWFVMASTQLVGIALLKPLEYQYADYADIPAFNHTKADTIVVLGDVKGPIELFHTLQIRRFVISSGKHTKKYAEKARELGVPGKAITLESESRDTREQAASLKKTLGSQPFILSTWALHMPRAMLVFRQEGMKPIPFPYGFSPRPKNVAGWILPSAMGRQRTNHALHEYAGLAWYTIAGLFRNP